MDADEVVGDEKDVGADIFVMNAAAFSSFALFEVVIITILATTLSTSCSVQPIPYVFIARK